MVRLDVPLHLTVPRTEGSDEAGEREQEQSGTDETERGLLELGLGAEVRDCRDRDCRTRKVDRANHAKDQEHGEAKNRCESSHENVQEAQYLHVVFHQ